MSDDNSIPFKFTEAARFIEAMARACRTNKVMISLTFTPYDEEVFGSIIESAEEKE